MEPIPGFFCTTIHDVVDIITNIVLTTTDGIKITKSSRLSKLELQIMEALWNDGALSIREILETL